MYFPGLGFGQFCRDDQLGSFVEILRVVIIKFLDRHDLSGNGGHRLVIAEHGAFDFAGLALVASHSLLNHDLAVELGSFFNGGAEFFRVVGLADSDGRSKIRRLHKYRKLQLAGDHFLDGLRVLFPLAA